jgi:cytochrome P450
VSRADRFPLGAGVGLDQLAGSEAHVAIAQLRALEPVSWLPALDGWLVTGYDLALEAMRAPDRFTVEDPRFSTARVIGRSMLSLDGEEHARHRGPFVAPFRIGTVKLRFEAVVSGLAERLLEALAPAGSGELRRGYAGPLAAGVLAHGLGLRTDEVDSLLCWYDAIVAAVTEITATGQGPVAGEQAFAALSDRLLRAMEDSADAPLLSDMGADSRLSSSDSSAPLSPEEFISNAAVLLFGGIETTEGMIVNALLHLLSRPGLAEPARDDPGVIDAVIEESLRLEPAAAVIDRYATADTVLGGARISGGELVRLSIAGANRDPAVFEAPDRFDLTRSGARRHLSFAHGPHVCIGLHLARLETRVALSKLLELERLELDPGHSAAASGLVFRKPPALYARWTPRPR